MTLTPERRSLIGKLGAHTLHAQVEDPVAHTAPARKAFLDRFERQVDPDGVLDPAERASRAEHAKKAYFRTLALKSARSRAASSAAKKERRTREHLDLLAAKAEVLGAGRPSTLYRFFSAAGELLYIGKTTRGVTRFYEHEGSALWWPLVAYSTCEHFDSDQQALAAEEFAIRTEHPLHNSRMNGEAT